YCSTSFLQDEPDYSTPRPAPIAVAPAGPDPDKRRKAILVSVAVFLVVMFFGLYFTVDKAAKGGTEVVATTYMVRSGPLRLQPNETTKARAQPKQQRCSRD